MEKEMDAEEIKDLYNDVLTYNLKFVPSIFNGKNVLEIIDPDPDSTMPYAAIWIEDHKFKRYFSSY